VSKPLIGITPAFYHHEELDRSIIAVNYTDKVQAAGGIPVIVPPIQEPETIPALLDRLDGIILGGGRDVQPSRYDAQRIPEIIRIQLPQRDRSDFWLVKEIWKRRFPVLGICLGLQELNVFRGGNLHQHIPAEVPGALIHKIDDMFEARHDVSIEKDSTLYEILRKPTVNTNSAHHQSIRDLGEGLRVTACTPDGIVEAVESTDDRPLLAVQWHPEMEEDEGVGLDLFRWLIGRVEQGG